MSGSEKDRLAELVIDQHCALQVALAENRKRYPTHEFRAFAAVMRQYVDVTGKDEMLHRNVVCAVNGLVQYLQSERKRVPNEVFDGSREAGMFALRRLRSVLRRR